MYHLFYNYLHTYYVVLVLSYMLEALPCPYTNYIVDLLPKGRAELVPSLIVTYERYESRLNKQPILRHMYNRLDTLQ